MHPDQAATMDAFMSLSSDFGKADASSFLPPTPKTSESGAWPPPKAPPAKRPRRSQGTDPRRLAEEAQRRLMAARGPEAEPLEVKNERVVAKDEPGVVVKDEPVVVKDERVLRKDEPVDVNTYSEVRDETNKMRRRPKKRRRRTKMRRGVWAAKDEEEATDEAKAKDEDDAKDEAKDKAKDDDDDKPYDPFSEEAVPAKEPEKSK